MLSLYIIVPGTVGLYPDCSLFLYSFRAEEGEVQSKFSHIQRMKYHRAITTFDVDIFL